MDFHGNLVLKGGGELRNMRVERLAEDPSVPLNGQIWFNTTDNVYRGYDGTAVTTFAVGGDTASLQAEIDAIESSVGLETDGTFIGFGESNYLTQAQSIHGAISTLDSQVFTYATALSQEVLDREDAVEALESVDNAIIGAVGLAEDGTLEAFSETNYLDETDNLVDAVLALDNQVGINTGAISTLTTDLADEIEARELEIQRVEGLITDEGTARGLAIGALQTEITNKLNGLKWKNSVKALARTNIALDGSTLEVDGVSLAAGDRVGVAGQTAAAENGIYVVQADNAAWVRSADFDQVSPIDEINAAAFYVEQGATYAITSWVQNSVVATVGSDAITFTQQNGAAGVTAGGGLVKTGNTIDVGEGNGIVVGADDISVALTTAGGLGFDEDGTIGIELDGSSLEVGANGVKVSDALTTEITDLRTDLGTTQSSLGDLSDVVSTIQSSLGFDEDALYPTAQFEGSNYLETSSSVVNALGLLDAAIDSVASAATDATDAVDTRLTNSYFLMTSSSAATTHAVAHNLNNEFPIVTVYDSTGSVIIPDSVSVVDANTLTVSFASAINCKVAVMAPFNAA